MVIGFQCVTEQGGRRRTMLQTQQVHADAIERALIAGDYKAVQLLSRLALDCPIAFGVERGDSQLSEQCAPWPAFEKYLRCRLSQAIGSCSLHDAHTAAHLVDGFYKRTPDPFDNRGNVYQTIAQSLADIVQEVQRAAAGRPGARHEFWRDSRSRTAVFVCYANFSGYRLERGARQETAPAACQYFLVPLQ